MQHPGGLRPDQIKQVRGFADQRLRNLKDPLDPSNRRVSIIVQYLSGESGKTFVEDPKDATSGKPSAAVTGETRVGALKDDTAKKDKK
jgi:chemotaxis protein MotB